MSLKFMRGNEFYRSSLWLHLPHTAIVIFFGWQKPSVLWL